MRVDNRKYDELRPVTITRNFTKYSAGSVLVESGNTKVICTASIEEYVPPHIKNTGTGWITAEYSLLPGATPSRVPRESTKGKISGRTHEIQRLIGRSLRAICDLTLLKERTIWIDCDVIQADGGTRTAAITGSYIALADAVQWLLDKNVIKENPLINSVAAISAGIVNNIALLDLCYAEDASAQVDMNFVMTGSGKYIEVQGTGEEYAFDEDQLAKMLTLARKGICEITEIQKKALGT
ncbi:ribonuclease PH [Candidatus Kuenenia stuttgartiensis]|jgi:ribonuclease PH|uniref:Ribonuclease PH n=1 Tax=Kuenenia stuttgartiensis TaxID=174633 RepID=A0A6G7GW30_KUEST|nr:ribonuclease PH [Candidatus Kuenenia stuttgartiensis]MBE7547894.1 ribonuclease PH [Planctomycetia bacterium]MBZ0192808.1 ribonuclease PH [Candidatus Kuenenia stuttgartiensis]QII13661.1 ribonuclease PH [Candidatus Kuenenia stuttgartiensis]TVL97835.1 MAG: ribonuclease PH [Candidatus Kuenenia stuttgartiensis]GJQ49705.1 MAG: ribonuclease PH [Candidatus Kuenenia stuttgartiensis]